MSEQNSNKKIIPAHVALILDGNRRWANERNLPSFEGHARGYAKLKHAADWFFLRGVEYLSAYVFSTENWEREKSEVDYIMNLLERVLEENRAEFNNKDYRLVFSGRLDELPGELPALCKDIEQDTKNNASGTLHMCLNYGGRPEILDAIRSIVKNDLEEEQIHEGIVRKYIYNGHIPDPDIIVRTGGEQRLSNFLLWQSSYSELMFMKKYWPEFEEIDAMGVIEEYSGRKRRFGV